MRLKKFTVREFRSVWDSGPIEVDDKVTCLVGKNEAGKTTLLTALYERRCETFGIPSHFRDRCPWEDLQLVLEEWYISSRHGLCADVRPDGMTMTTAFHSSEKRTPAINGTKH